MHSSKSSAPQSCKHKLKDQPLDLKGKGEAKQAEVTMEAEDIQIAEFFYHFLLFFQYVSVFDALGVFLVWLIECRQLKRNLKLDVQSAVTSNNTSVVIQMIVAFVFMVKSFTVMYTVVGGVNEVGRAVMGHPICFSVIFVADTLVFVASLAVTMILATSSHISTKMEYFIHITLSAAVVLFALIYHAAVYVVVPPHYKWIVLCFGGAAAITLALLLFHELSTKFMNIKNDKNN